MISIMIYVLNCVSLYAYDFRIMSKGLIVRPRVCYSCLVDPRSHRCHSTLSSCCPGEAWIVPAVKPDEIGDRTIVYRKCSTNIVWSFRRMLRPSYRRPDDRLPVAASCWFRECCRLRSVLIVVSPRALSDVDVGTRPTCSTSCSFRRMWKTVASPAADFLIVAVSWRL